MKKPEQNPQDRRRAHAFVIPAAVLLAAASPQPTDIIVIVS
jgi:hypothetical protein